MMTDPVITALAAACILLACALALSLRRQRRVAATLDAEVAGQAHKIGRLEADLAALIACAREVGTRVGATERAERLLQKQLDQLALVRDDSQVAVEHAMKLLERGQSMNEVTRICELSEGEVEILQNLARYRPAA